MQVEDTNVAEGFVNGILGAIWLSDPDSYNESEQGRTV